MKVHQTEKPAWKNDPALAYVLVAKRAIAFANSRDELMDWWTDEDDNRVKHGLTPVLVEELAQACRDHIEHLKQHPRNEPIPMRPRR
jgi:hypothetical protein